MAFDAFLQIKESNGINADGETRDEDFKNAFEIKSFSFGAENTINIGSSSGGGGAGKATFKEFNVAKNTDSASCGLFLACCSGIHFKEATLTLRRSGESGAGSGGNFMIFKFLMLMVQDIEWSGSDGDDVPEENVNFQYGALSIEYKMQGIDGKMKKVDRGLGEAEWSRVLNKKTFAVM
ncbi:Hcp family type VI secretion system effector [Qingshengfaniella alkalisoli]|uniref:Type VI secretion system tube protein Hcp n=1 Tax=Qingshengfaniella alkalisoli TaxID=2599296 RepID=A0A5B8J171_9RHOB|nr:type VI secretion system tube protein Hcp [Qingshengfaniella alkalisoli]QDY70931.1 type VI secretion system tube protein Hcp [Qingshengfaniella alkalisoli]